MTKNCLGLFLVLAMAGCTSAVGESDVGSSGEALALEAEQALQIAGILGYEISGLLEDPGALPEGGEPIPGPSGSEPIGSSDCTNVGWEPENLFGVTVELDNCVLDNGDVVNGTVAVSLLGGERAEVHVIFDDLAVGDRFVTGTMALSSQGTDIGLDADLQYIAPDTNMGIELRNMRMSLRGEGVHFIGQGTITESGERWALTVDNVLWSGASLCHPSAGSVELEQPGHPSMTLMFSPGSVTVQIGMQAPKTLETGC